MQPAQIPVRAQLGVAGVIVPGLETNKFKVRHRATIVPQSVATTTAKSSMEARNTGEETV